jgi:hypothetical protein
MQDFVYNAFAVSVYLFLLVGGRNSLCDRFPSVPMAK